MRPLNDKINNVFNYGGYLELTQEYSSFNYLTIYAHYDNKFETITDYGKVKGYIENDIVDGILLIEASSETATEEDYNYFINKLETLPIITEQDLRDLIPVTINGNYGDPF